MLAFMVTVFHQLNKTVMNNVNEMKSLYGYGNKVTYFYKAAGTNRNV